MDASSAQRCSGLARITVAAQSSFPPDRGDLSGVPDGRQLVNNRRRASFSMHPPYQFRRFLLVSAWRCERPLSSARIGGFGRFAIRRTRRVVPQLRPSLFRRFSRTREFRPITRPWLGHPGPAAWRRQRSSAHAGVHDLVSLGADVRDPATTSSRALALGTYMIL